MRRPIIVRHVSMLRRDMDVLEWGVRVWLVLLSNSQWGDDT